MDLKILFSQKYRVLQFVQSRISVNNTEKMEDFRMKAYFALF